MKYSILGFNQKAVLEITKDVIVEHKGGDTKYKTLKLDCADLLILQDVADFMNRKKIIKYTVDDKIYFSIQYSAIIDDLPILGIKQQALSDRLSKLVELEMLEKTVIKNQSGSFVAFRLGEKYESIKYTPNTTNDCTSSETPCTSSPLHLQEYQTTSAQVVDYIPKDSFTNNSFTNNNNKKENKDNKLSLSKKDEEVPNWKTDFKAYLELVYDAKKKLLANMSVKAKKLEYYPNINYELTIEKMVDDFWGTEEGWKNKIKVSKKSNTIDMVKTLVKGFDYKQNRVYKSIKSSGYGNNYTNTYQQPYSGSNRLIDGENEDGTFNRNGYRYYHSMRDNRDYSIPINAVPMPSFDCEFDMNTEKWYHPDIKNDVNGDLW